MDRIPSSPPCIPALGALVQRPLWSVMIPVFNCAKFLPDALNSVLRQDFDLENMQIEVVDDASTDADVKEVVERIGKGRVSYFRQHENLGSLRNFETCINRSKGRLIHLLHGDDRVKQGFYKKMTALFEEYPQSGAAICRYSFINDSGVQTHRPIEESNKDGILDNWLLRIAECQRTQYVATVVRREVYEKLGGFYGMTYAEDWEMWVRIAKHYPVVYTPEILAEYREHEDSISSKKTTGGRMTQDFLKAITHIQEHLPEKDRKKILLRSKKNCALFNLGVANQIWNETHNKVLTDNNIKQAFRLSKHPSVCYEILKLCIKTIIK